MQHWSGRALEASAPAAAAHCRAGCARRQCHPMARRTGGVQVRPARGARPLARAAPLGRSQRGGAERRAGQVRQAARRRRGRRPLLSGGQDLAAPGATRLRGAGVAALGAARSASLARRWTRPASWRSCRWRSSMWGWCWSSPPSTSLCRRAAHRCAPGLCPVSLPAPACPTHADRAPAQAFHKGVGPFLTHLSDPDFLHAVRTARGPRHPAPLAACVLRAAMLPSLGLLGPLPACSGGRAKHALLRRMPATLAARRGRARG